MRLTIFAGSVAAAVVCASARAAPLQAQATERVFACYVPLVGLAYLIKQPGLADECIAIGPIRHVEISWDKQGPRGDKGPQGPTGPTGAAGPGGAGAPGPKGPTGATGLQGDVGDKGVTGDPGPMGATGPVGAAGALGDKGPTGVMGPAGATGAVGDTGPAGVQGPTGAQGAAGEQGPPGEKGPVGAQGPDGAAGETGAKGPVGPQGPTGAQGAPGTAGATGDKGPIGPPGQDGVGVPCDACVTTALIADLAVTNEKLATITAPGKIANSATSASNTSLANRIVTRDAAGGIAAGTGTMESLNLVGSAADVRHGALSAGRFLFRAGGTAPEDASVYFGTAAGTGAASGPQNVGVGGGAQTQFIPGNSNVAVGKGAMSNVDGSGNTIVGSDAMDQASFGGDLNVVLGWRTARNLGASGAQRPVRTIVIGTEAGTNMGAGHSNTLVVGRAAVTGARDIDIGTPGTHTRAFMSGIDNSAVAGVPVLVNSAGQVGVVVSSARFKTDVRDIGSASTLLYGLRPVTYRYRADVIPSAGNVIPSAARDLQFGLIAEEVARVTPHLVARDSTGRPYTVRYDQLVPLLLNEVQRKRAQLMTLQANNAALFLRLEQLETTVKP